MNEILELLQSSAVVTTAVAFLFGLLIGSFLNVVIYRLPLMMQREWRRHCDEMDGKEPTQNDQFNLVHPRSACPKCDRPIRAVENIPVLSWLWLRGRCAGCSTRISARYPLVELATGLVAAAVAWQFGATWETLAALVFSFALISLTMIDYDHKLLPDSITLPLLWMGLMLSLAAGALPSQTLFVSPRDAIIGAAAGYLSLRSVYELFKLATGKEGMGFGDFKLLAAIGAWLGWQALPLVIMLSAVVGAIVGVCLITFTRHGRQNPIPFGPFLAAAGWIAMLWGEQLSAAYLRISGIS